MRRHVLFLALLGCAAAGWRTAADAGGDSSGPPAAGDAYDVVLLAPPHPVFVRLHVQVDGAGLKGVRFAYAEELIRRNDRNDDRVLDHDEAGRIAPLVKSSNASETFSIAESWVSVDRDPADEQVTAAELADWIDRVLGFPFSLAARPQRATQSIDLFGLLDLDRNGLLDVSEQADAERSLRKLDLDQDETFTADELRPLISQQARVAAADPNREDSNQPFLLLADDESLRIAAARIMQRYLPAKRGEKVVAALSAERLGLDPADIAGCDANGDGMLNAAELAQLLHAPRPHVELAAELHQARPGRATLKKLSDRLSSVEGAKSPRSDRLTLVAGGVAVEWRVQSSRAVTTDNRKLFRTRFLTSDRDKNKYLDEQEFASLGIPNTTFAQVDRDGDGMLVEAELLLYVDQEASSSQARIEMTVSHNGKSVFEVLDENADRRITRREIRKAVERLRGFDRDRDGRLSTVELTGQFVATLELGKPLQFRNENAPAGTNAAPIVNRPAEGPDWFVKMDRNRDGDVSRHEFLGPPAVFRRFDADEDGLISLQEAESAAMP